MNFKSIIAQRNIRNIFGTNFILILALSAGAYIHSSMLEGLDTALSVGVLFALGSVGAIVAVSLAPKILKMRGVTKTVMRSGIWNILALLTISFSVSPLMAIVGFIMYFASLSLMVLAIDVLLEHYSSDSNTGGIRGISLALGNLAFLIGPLVAGYVADARGFSAVYFMTSIGVALMLLFFWTKFKKFKHFPKQAHTNGIKNFVALIRNKALFKVYKVAFSLEFFFSIWSIFMTIYMNTVIGFSWTEIGILFAIMHVPYIIFEPFIGWLADNKWGEKEMMAIGIVIITITTFILAMTTDSSFWLWAVLLFFSRTGSSMVQVTNESYFFKHVGSRDTNIISAFRNAAPLGLLIGPLVGGAILNFVDYQDLFFILSILVLFAIIPALKLKDTR
jgi:MFS family permease